MSTQRIDNALQKFRRGSQGLYTDEGQKLYSDEEHERRHEALLAEFDREKDSVVSEADRAIEKAERDLALEHRDLSDSLTTAELERANAKRSYVEDDVWNLDPETLVRRARAAQAAGDRPTMFLYARALQRRSEVEHENGSGEDGAHLAQLAIGLTQIVRGPDAERDLERARKAKRDATSLKVYAGQQRQEVDGTSRRVLEDTRSYIAGRL